MVKMTKFMSQTLQQKRYWLRSVCMFKLPGCMGAEMFLTLTYFHTGTVHYKMNKNTDPGPSCLTKWKPL